MFMLLVVFKTLKEEEAFYRFLSVIRVILTLGFFIRIVFP